MTTSPGIEATGISKAYGENPVLQHLDLTVERGPPVCPARPDGTGKTTAVRILSTLLRPDSGTARICGFDIGADRHLVRQRISLTGQEHRSTWP